MTTEADKKLIIAIENGVLTKELFKTKKYSSLFTELAKIGSATEFGQLTARLGGDTISALANLSEDSKVKMLRRLAAAGYLEEQPSFWGIVPHIFRHETIPIPGVKMLEQTVNIPFKVNIAIDTLSTFMGRQYIDLEFKKPELSSNPINDPYRGSEKFSYTTKPGIRQFVDLKFTSNGNTVQEYNYLDVLRIDKELIKDSFYQNWNKAIGHDLHVVADVYNQANEVTYGVLTKSGYQTPKHDQEGLRMRVPLFFNYNMCFTDKFNLNSFLEGSLTIEGTLIASNKMVKAEFYPDDVTEPVVQLECKPLVVERINLVTDKFFVGDQYHALMSSKQISKFVRYFGNKVGTIKENDPENKIEVLGKGYVEAITFCIRPASYADDFEKWEQLSEVSQQCSPTAIVVENINGDFNKLAVKPAKIYKPTSPLELIGFNVDGEVVKPMSDPEHYGNMEALRIAHESDLYYPRDNTLYKFHFNYHYKQKMLSGMFVQTKLTDRFIDYKFKSEYLAENDLLKEKWQYIIFRDLCNQQYATGSSITTLYQL